MSGWIVSREFRSTMVPRSRRGAPDAMSRAMSDDARQAWNRCRYVPGTAAGHYESYFQRANHPTRPRAFWIRYTIFSPRGAPADAVGELWAIWFDGERERIVAAKEAITLAECAFGEGGVLARIGTATLAVDSLTGSARAGAHALAWELEYGDGEDPLLLLPVALYERALPKAKALVGRPNAVYRGTLTVDGEAHVVDGWVGSQNHNWGSRHTDRYAWGQVAGFDGEPASFLECATARLRVGPLWLPAMTLVVLRLGAERYALNSLTQAVRARGRVDGLAWRFASRGPGVAIDGTIAAPPSRFVGLRYANPPGGSKICLNSKLAACELTLRRPGRPAVTLRTASRAAFEILDDETRAGVPVVI
jgi:hypothetical protein